MAGRFTQRRNGLWSLIGLMPHAPYLLALAYSDSFAVVAVFAFASGLGLEPFQVWWSSALQRDAPAELLARVISLDWLMSLRPVTRLGRLRPAEVAIRP